jgi:hypothetical protein
VTEVATRRETQSDRGGPFARHALRLLDNGFHVGPVNGKVPVTPRGCYGFTKDLDTLIAFVHDYGDHNIAIRCDGMTVLDADDRDSAAWLAGNHPDAPLTWTGKGAHAFFRGESRMGVKVEVAPGVFCDVRSGIGAYVVAPGSVHESGAMYTIDPSHPALSRENLPPLPGSVAEKLLPRRSRERGSAEPETRLVSNKAVYLDAAARKIVARMSEAQPGTRNDTLWWQAFGLGRLAADMEHATVRLVVKQLGLAASQRGLPSHEVTATMGSGLDHGVRRPVILVEPEPASAVVETSAPDDLQEFVTRLKILACDLSGHPTPAEFNAAREAEREGDSEAFARLNAFTADRQAAARARLPKPSKRVEGCGEFGIIRVKARGPYWAPTWCDNSWGCPKHREKRATDTLTALADRFGDTNSLVTEFPTKPLHNDYVTVLSETHLPGLLYVSVLPVPALDKSAHRRWLRRLYDAAEYRGAEFVTFQLPDDLVVFATHDLNEQPGSGRGGRRPKLEPARFHRLDGPAAAQLCRNVAYSGAVTKATGVPNAKTGGSEAEKSRRLRDAPREVFDRAHKLAIDVLTPLLPPDDDSEPWAAARKFMHDDGTAAAVLIQALDAIGHVKEPRERRSISEDEVDMDALARNVKALLALQEWFA